MYILFNDDCLEKMKTLDESSVDSIVTDPPYGLSFMGKGWDHGVPGKDFWVEALRVAKPGAHLLAFGGTRTFHRLACAIEDAGWEIRDTVMWVYGSGFPKSHDVSKAIDRAAGAEREVVGTKRLGGNAAQSTKEKGGTYASNTNSVGVKAINVPITAPATDAAKQWEGWGTALKPAWEPIIVARKPLIGTVAENVLKHGTGALNIDGSRIGEPLPATTYKQPVMNGGKYGDSDAQRIITTVSQGRWPANVIHDGSDEVLAGFPVTTQNGYRANPSTKHNQHRNNTYGKYQDTFTVGERGFNDTGSAARFFYCAKASKADRDERNHHPTVKPTDLMRYLCRLVTPLGGLVLDPFCGSGSTGKAAMLENFKFIGIEKEAEYIEIAKARIENAYQSIKKNVDVGVNNQCQRGLFDSIDDADCDISNNVD
jgi:DNA modification methylase